MDEFGLEFLIKVIAFYQVPKLRRSNFIFVISDGDLNDEENAINNDDNENIDIKNENNKKDIGSYLDVFGLDTG
jgi:hypothetical protein